MKVIISAGGTGGHIYPALALINKMKEKFKDLKVLYIGTTDRMEKDIVPNMGIDYYGIKVSGLSKNPIRCFNSITNLLKASFKCKKIIKKFNPDIVIGVGGYVTVPVIYEAHKLKIKTILHEQNSIPGKANKFLSKYADVVCCSFKDSMKYFDKEKTVFTGNPRGEEVIKCTPCQKKDYNLDENKKLVLITNGSLGASTINKKIMDMVTKFKDKDYEVLLVLGKDNYEIYKNTSVPVNVKLTPYVENMGELLKRTDLIVTRAGATIIAEITALGIPSILIPSPYVANNHQYLNALSLKNNDATILIEEKNFDETLFLNNIDKILYDKEFRNNLISNTKKLGVTDASTRIINEILKLVK